MGFARWRAFDTGGRVNARAPKNDLHLDAKHLWSARGNRRFGGAL
jgi:hypothetical protein